MSIKPTKALLALMLSSVTGAYAQKTVSITINANQGRKVVSPYIYGTNDAYDKATAKRLGGNRVTNFNWETNASNAGHDWRQHSDDWLPWHVGVPEADYNKTGSTITKFHNQSLSQQAYTLMTLPMAGYVANDKDGTVSVYDAAPSTRWAKVVNRKNAPLSLQPDLTDRTIYVDEELNFILNQYGKSNTSTGIKGYSLDNEPCLWFSTHPLLWGTTGVKVSELLSRSVDLAKLIKEMDGTAEVFGPSLYGFTAYQNLQFASDWDDIRRTGDYNYFIEYYLAKMKQEEQQNGKRLLDVLDLHWYPEGNADFEGVSPFGNNNDRNSIGARVAMTRSLWDSTYRENTWIGREHAQGILPLLPKLKKIIDSRYPGTKLAITEYAYMGYGHVSGAIAQTDALGIFGQQDVYMANFWGAIEGYVKTGFDLYRNYDGNGSTFGETFLQTQTSDVANTSAYASVHAADESKLHTIAINKNLDSAVTVKIALTANRQYKSARVWLVDSKSPEIKMAKNIRVINNNSFEYSLPPLTIAHFVLTEEDLSIYPFFDTMYADSKVGYSDGKAMLAVGATILDGDNNLNTITIDLSPIGGNANTPMVRNGNTFTINASIPKNSPSGLKTLTITAKDAQNNIATNSIEYRVIKKMAPSVIWDGDAVATGEGHSFYDANDIYRDEVKIERQTTGGNRKPGSMHMHFKHEENKWNLFAWRFDPSAAGAKNISEYGFVEFYIKSNAPKDADLEISLRDATGNMTTSNTILLKAGGYISDFSSKSYTKVKVPIAAFTEGNNIDLTRIWQINFSCNSAVGGFDTWIDDINAYPYTNMNVQPKFTEVTMTPDGGYADGQTVVTITAKATDPDSNIKNVVVDMSSVDRQNNKTLALANGIYSGTFTVPTSVIDGTKKIALTVTDANYNTHDTALNFTVHAKASTDVIWNADEIATGTFEVVNTGSYSIDSTAGNFGPKAMKLHLVHSAENPFSAVVLDWNNNTGNTRRIDFSNKRYLTFYLKATPVSNDFDLMLIIKDQYADEIRPIWLKSEGYVTNFTGNYQLVRIPISRLKDGTKMDMQHVTRIGFLTQRSLNGTDVFVDDITISGSSVADVQFEVKAAQCGANGTIKVTSVNNSNASFSYYINNRVNSAGINNPEFTKLLPGTYDVTVKGDSGFVYKETINVPGSTSVKVTGIVDSIGGIDVTATGGTNNYSFAWSNGMTTEDVAGLSSGSYKVVVTDRNSACSTSRSFTVVNSGLNLKLYPNPASTYITLDYAVIEPLSTPVVVSIVNKFGHPIANRTYTTATRTEKFTLNNQSPDVYYVIVNVNGKTYTKNFMVN